MVKRRGIHAVNHLAISVALLIDQCKRYSTAGYCTIYHRNALYTVQDLSQCLTHYSTWHNVALMWNPLENNKSVSSPTHHRYFQFPFHVSSTGKCVHEEVFHSSELWNSLLFHAHILSCLKMGNIITYAIQSKDVMPMKDTSYMSFSVIYTGFHTKI